MTEQRARNRLRRIVHIWLERLATDRLTRPRTGAVSASAAPAYDYSRPLITIRKTNNAWIVCGTNEVAEQQGLYARMSLSEARAQIPGLQVEQADDRADAAVLTKIAQALERYTPFVGLDPPTGLFLDISGCAHLFGGEAALVDDLLSRLRHWGFGARAAAADTPALAWAMARFGESRIVAPGRKIDAIGHLPAAALRLPEETEFVLARLGLKTIDAMFGQPRSALVRRCGEDLARRMDQALGLVAEPITPLAPVEPFSVERRFAEPLMDVTSIGLCVRKLCLSLAHSLRSKGEGARRLSLRLFHSDGAVRDAAVGTSEPLVDPDRMAALLMPHLEALSARIEHDSGIDIMRLSASETGPLRVQQEDFYADPDMMANLERLIDTLSVRLGTSAVQRFVPVDTHLPIAADLRVPAQTMVVADPWPVAAEIETAWEETSEPPLPRRPIRLFHPPEPIEVLASVPDGPPARFVWRRVSYQVAAAEGPERIGASWWTSEEMRTCDYFAVEDVSGHRFWVFRQGLLGRETSEPRWFIHGLFA